MQAIAGSRRVRSKARSRPSSDRSSLSGSRRHQIAMARPPELRSANDAPHHLPPWARPLRRGVRCHSGLRRRRLCQRERSLTRVSADPFTNTSSQHATEVEPDTFAFGSTVLAAYQVGRFFDGGSVRHRLRPLHGRRRHLGRLELPAGAHVQRRPVRRFEHPVRARQRSERRLRRQARHVDDLVDPDPPGEPGRPHDLRQPLDRRRRDLRHPGADPAAGQEGQPRQELDRATTTRAARSTATATRSSTTSARATSST